MARCEECLHFDLCEALEKGNGLMKVHPIYCGFYKPTADVAPKSEVEFWQDTAANAKKEILLEIERLALSKIPEDVNAEMLKDTYYIEAIDELMIKYGVTDKNVGCKIEEEKE